MGRIARSQLLNEGCYAHVFTRSIEKHRIFKNDKDFEQFKKALGEAKTEYGFEVFHYCVMQTHFHLIVRISDVQNFSKGMKTIKKDCTHWYNRKQQRFGPIWRDRFKCKLIENEQYLFACGRYVEDNPVRAGLVKEAVDWPHSSSRHYHLGEKDTIVDPYPELAEVKDLKIDEAEFERRVAIGSDWFQFNVAKRLKG